MKTAKWALAAAFVGALAMQSVSCAADPAKPAAEGHKAIVVGKDSSGKKIAVPAGQTFVVRLPGNATTGYMWALAKIDGPAVEQVGKDEYIPDPPPGGKPLTGSGGVSVFTFKAAKAGAATISLEYKRSWEKDQPPAEKFSVTVDVK